MFKVLHFVLTTALYIRSLLIFIFSRVSMVVGLGMRRLESVTKLTG